MKRNGFCKKCISRRTPALLLALALLCCACLPGAAVELTKPCSITLNLGSGFAEDLGGAALVADVYQIAAAEELPGQDAYELRALAPFEALPVAAVQTQDEAEALSRAAGYLALREAAPVVTEAALGRPIDTTDGGEPLLPGLYLVLVHLAGESDYTVYGETSDTLIATTANAGDYCYAFAPLLLSLPTKQGEDGTLVTTDLPGEWQYDLTAVLKAERSPRYGALEITKTLLACAEDRPGLFVFEVEAVLDGVTVYSDVFNLRFEQAGQQTLLIEHLPVGAVVTVTEVYAGVCYASVGSSEQSVVISAEQTQQAAFVNDYAPTANQGGGIENTFTFGNNGSWDCTQDPAPGSQEAP